MEAKHTPGPWVASFESVDPEWAAITTVGGSVIANVNADSRQQANAHLIAAAPDMLEALRLHKAWSDSERAGPDYGGQTRDTHPCGEAIWRAWWDFQLDICERAQKATDAALSKAEGRS